MKNWFRRPRVQHPVARGLYASELARPFLPGASAQAFVPELSDPIVYFFGRGNVAGSMRTSQGMQFFAPPTVTEVSLGGIVSGQIITQQLTNADGSIG